MRGVKMGVAAALAVAVSAAAQPGTTEKSQAPKAKAPAAAQQVDPRAVVAEVRRIIAARYVLPERRPALDAVLAEGLSSGRYNVRDPAVLAQRINADLERVGRDRHLGLTFNRQQAALLTARRNEAAPDPTGFERQVRAANHGVTELRVLPGNIRYIAYDGFMWIGPESAAALENALRFLSGGEAIIMDLRRNGGGDSDPSRFLLSHFLPPNHPLYTYYRDGGTRATRVSTLPDAPAGHLAGKPLYVLISDSTASAAEEFSGNVRGYGIGELVGANTAGAGFAADLVPIAGSFVLSVSTGRVVLASTGRDWERTGHAPTIPSAVEAALDVAHAHVLQRLAARSEGPERASLEAMAEAVDARIRPRTPAAPLEAYAGVYGERTVFVDEGRLWYRRAANQVRRQLLPLGGSRFALNDDPATRIIFDRSGDRVTALGIARANAPVHATYQRTE